MDSHTKAKQPYRQPRAAGNDQAGGDRRWAQQSQHSRRSSWVSASASSSPCWSGWSDGGGDEQQAHDGHT